MMSINLESILADVEAIDKRLSEIENNSLQGQGSIINHGYRFDVDVSLHLSELLNTTKNNTEKLGSSYANGSENYIPKWDSDLNLATSAIYENNNSIVIGHTVAGAKLDINGDLKIRTIGTDTTNDILIKAVNNVVKSRSIDSRIWNIGDIFNDTTEPTGFPNRTSTTLAFVDGTRTLTIVPTASSFYYYISGTEYEKTASDSLVISDTEGIHVVYYDGDALVESVSPNKYEIDIIIRTKALASIIYWDVPDSEAIYVGEERHGIVMPGSTHSYLHFVNGLVYLSGLGSNNMSVDGSGNNNASAQFGIDSGTVADEDIHTSVSAVNYVTGLPIYYMLGSTPRWVKYTNTGYSVRTLDGTSSTRLAYNQLTGGSRQLTEVTNGDFVLCHVFATTEKDNPMISVMGQEVYTTKRAARRGANTEILSLQLDDLLFPEIRPIGTYIFQTKSAYTNAVKGRIVSTDDGSDYVDWRSETISRVALSTSDHGSLTGLTDDDHDQYLLLAGRGGQTIEDNVGIGVTPKTDWQSTRSVLQIGGTGSIYQLTTPGVNAGLFVATNTYYNGSDFKAIYNDEASYTQQINGEFRWNTAPAVAADTVQTFTERMVLDVDGKMTLSLAGNPYTFLNNLTHFAITSETSGSAAYYDYFTKDGDGTDIILQQIFANGAPGSGTGVHKLVSGYYAGTEFNIHTQAQSGAAHNLVLGGDGQVDQINLSSVGVVINEDGNGSYDFRIEGDTNANLFSLDAGLDYVGIGKTPVASKGILQLDMTTDDLGIVDAESTSMSLVTEAGYIKFDVGGTTLYAKLYSEPV